MTFPTVPEFVEALAPNFDRAACHIPTYETAKDAASGIQTRAALTESPPLGAAACCWQWCRATSLSPEKQVRRIVRMPAGHDCSRRLLPVTKAAQDDDTAGTRGAERRDRPGRARYAAGAPVSGAVEVP